MTRSHELASRSVRVGYLRVRRRFPEQPLLAVGERVQQLERHLAAPGRTWRTHGPDFFGAMFSRSSTFAGNVSWTHEPGFSDAAT